MTTQHTAKVRRFLSRLQNPAGIATPDSAQEGLVAESLAIEPAAGEAESIGRRFNLDDRRTEAVDRALRKIAKNEDLDSQEAFYAEAIIIPDKRPAVSIVNGDFTVDHPMWARFSTNGALHESLKRALQSVGRIELVPGNPSAPFVGTGFVVGKNLLMTNRHVAKLFAFGLGDRVIRYRSGSAAIDFRRENDTEPATLLELRRVAMIHPYWDMALLEVEGLEPERRPLTLSLREPEDLENAEIAVIGYPAFDPRNDVGIQNEVFGGVFNVKRLQPGLIMPRASIRSFEHDVSAVCHDSSTLGGNSGSCVYHPKDGTVVALHFAGVYLERNYGVPTSELARDGRVVDAGVNFAPGASGGTPPWAAAWHAADRAEEGAAEPSTPAAGGAKPADTAAAKPGTQTPVNPAKNGSKPTGNAAGDGEGGKGEGEAEGNGEGEGKGKGGEGNGGGEGGDGAAPAGAPTGTVQIDDTLSIEVDIITLAALREIAGKVALSLRPPDQQKARPVIIGGEKVVTALRAYRGFAASAAQLQSELTALLKQAGGRSPQESAAEAMAPKAMLDTLAATLASLDKVLAFFRADTEYKGRKVDLKDTALYPALAGALISHHIPTYVPEFFPSATGAAADGTVLASLDTLRSLRDQVEVAKTDTTPATLTAEIDKLVASVDALLGGVFQADADGEPVLLDRLLLGAEFATLLAGAEKPLFLSAHIVTAGGSYRKRRHLFTTLFTGDLLSYGGGAAIGYFVFDTGTSALAGGDLLYHAIGHTVFPAGPEEFWPSNVVDPPPPRRKTGPMGF